MAVMSPMPATLPRDISSQLCRDIPVPGIMTSITEIVEEPNPNVVDDTIYVAVTKDVKDSQLNLIWAMHNSKGKKICILHVHVPAAMIPLMGAKFPPSSLKEQEVRAYREIERRNMHMTLDEYLRICQQMGVRAEKLHIEMDCIEKGIIELISQYNIQELVMGAASNKHYSRRMNLRSKKAIYVCEQAPTSCSIEFICKGFLIHTRKRSLDGGNVDITSPSVHQVPDSEAGSLPLLRSKCTELDKNHFVKLTNPAQELIRRVRPSNDGLGRSIVSVSSSAQFSTPQNMSGREVSSDESNGQPKWSTSFFSTCYDNCSVEPVLTPDLIIEGSDNLLELTLSDLSPDLLHSSPPSVLEDGGTNDTPYEQLENAMAEAEDARRVAYHEIVRRGKAEKEAIDAIRRAKTAEISYKEELKLRKELEESLEKEKEELDIMNSQRDKVKEELQLALNQKSSLESQIASTELTIKELEEKIISAVDLLQNYKNERNDLQMQRSNALREAEDLRKEGEPSSSQVLQFFSEFSFLEIEEATNNFNPSMKIGEGGYGSIFKGIMRHTEVAAKMLHPDSIQGPSEFQREVDALSKIRHPNLITLIGACPESWTLVYEYLPNGSLEDRLCCKDNTPPLTWQSRIRIAAELCSALIFLHSCKPHSIVHGDLKPSNILLDANLVSKLSDFGICRILSCFKNSCNISTQFLKTDPKGTFVYMDPEFLASGELTTKSDVYSFGIILLRLLTGRSASGIVKEVKYALDIGKLKLLLDPLAGDWPFVQAEQLTRLALRCCEMNGKNRPDLYSDVWRMLEPARASSGGTNTFGLGSQRLNQPPPYFVCPIFQEVMCNPHVAADGFTYEAEAIRGWLDSGHDTSPMTNSNLAHSNLVPDHTLRSAIQDWLQSQ